MSSLRTPPLAKRKANFTMLEKSILLDLTKGYPIVSSSSKDSKTQRSKDEAWQMIAVLFNDSENISVRTPQELRICYQNLLQKAKKDESIHQIRKREGVSDPNIGAPTVKRKANFSPLERSLLIHLANQYPIVVSSCKDMKTQKSKDEAWKCIETLFNTEEDVCNRTSQELRTCFQNLTQKARKQDALEWQELQMIKMEASSASPSSTPSVTDTMRAFIPHMFESVETSKESEDNTIQRTEAQNMFEPPPSESTSGSHALSDTPDPHMLNSKIPTSPQVMECDSEPRSSVEKWDELKMRLMIEEHQVRIKLMMEEHEWKREQHKWLREEHRIRLNSLIRTTNNHEIISNHLKV
ncbi:uncharacterized protein LOC117118947 [Anneissia japonica]|uniref:uncharacterized protein LOC117118947 n=1 Tax=Anneissia japonica TaxID=1529436 RepID=UPI001425A8FF|nr:uncharacterized protein LOC117118947 [Anneissia japonica]